MKIVLNNTERQTFERFVMEYTKSVIDATDNAFKVEIMEKIEQVSMIDALDRAGFNTDGSRIVELPCGGCEIELDAEIISAFNIYMANSMVIFRPHTTRLTLVLNKHKNTIINLIEKAKKVNCSKHVKRVAKGIFAMLGLEDLYTDLLTVIEGLEADKIGEANMDKNIEYLTAVIKKVSNRTQDTDTELSLKLEFEDFCISHNALIRDMEEIIHVQSMNKIPLGMKPELKDELHRSCYQHKELLKYYMDKGMVTTEEYVRVVSFINELFMKIN